MSDAACEFATHLSATYTDWPMDDPLVRVGTCKGCGADQVLVREVVQFAGGAPQPGGRLASSDGCLPCYRKLCNQEPAR